MLGIVFSALVLLNFRCSALSTEQLIEGAGYKCETHYITSEDGFIIAYHRIPNLNKPAVILNHGILLAASSFVAFPNRSLGFVLADAGYDVWIANARGTSYSRNHTSLNAVSNPKEFFDYSFHEIGKYDIPAAIDYILNLSKQKSLHYIGFSQGTTSFFVTASVRPSCLKKVRLASLMAPAVVIGDNLGYKTVSNIYFQLVEELNNNNIYDFKWSPMLRQFLERYCGKNDLFTVFCRNIYGLLAGGSNNHQLQEEDMSTFASNFPEEFSLKELEHYAQYFYNSDGFSQFDYGSAKNQLMYGSTKAPHYDLSKLTSPIALYVGRNDGITGYENLPKALKVIPKKAIVKYFEPADPKFNHLDFVIAKEIVRLLYNEMIKFMKTFD